MPDDLVWHSASAKWWPRSRPSTVQVIEVVSERSYLAITEGDFPKRLGIPLEVEQIKADHEDPAIKKRFEHELHKS